MRPIRPHVGADKRYGAPLNIWTGREPKQASQVNLSRTQAGKTQSPRPSFPVWRPR
jgi:hypothetical protein